MDLRSGIENFKENKDSFRELQISDSAIKQIYESTENKSNSFNKDAIKVITLNMLMNQYSIKNNTKLLFQIDKINGISYLKNSEVYREVYDKYYTIFHDIRYFPVPKDIISGVEVSYENSWKMPRTYGGNRIHEGTDIMAGNNKAGYFPVISVSDGIIEQKGWLEQGGYRIGVRSESGAYFYYAHLSSYNEELEPGDSVMAGTILGYMGNTGYSKIVGTTGKFDVHLHFGIYLNDNGKEMSVNPYWVLKYLEDYKLYFKRKNT